MICIFKWLNPLECYIPALISKFGGSYKARVLKRRGESTWDLHKYTSKRKHTSSKRRGKEIRLLLWPIMSILQNLGNAMGDGNEPGPLPMRTYCHSESIQRKGVP